MCRKYPNETHPNKNVQAPNTKHPAVSQSVGIEEISTHPASAISRFFSLRVLAILHTELLWIWLPSVVFAAGVLLFRGN